MILDTLNAELKQAMIARDALRVSVVRFLISAIKNKEIELRGQGIELEDKHVLKSIQKQIKQHKDSIEAYQSGGRDDLVQKETAELEILEEFLEKFTPAEEGSEQDAAQA
jgi:uncharacterized protein YqeY